MLSRPLYRFARFSFKPVPGAKRAQALQLQLREWSAYPVTGQYVAWDGGDALVWAWDAERVNAAIVAAKLAPARVRVVPETVLHAARASGLYLVSCLDGVEAQLWRGGRLTHSRWWPARPGAADWINFQRDAGILPQAQMEQLPAAQPASLQAHPWCKPAGLAAFGGGLQHEFRLAAGGAVVLAAFTLWYGIEIVKIHQAFERHSSELAALEQRARPMLEARRQAQDALARVQVLQGHDRFPDQLTLLAGVSQQLPRPGTHLREWEYRDGKLKFTLATTGKLSTSAVVQSFQLAGWFANVQAAAGGDPASMTLTMDVLPWAEAKPPAPAALEPLPAKLPEPLPAKAPQPPPAVKMLRTDKP